MNYCSQYGRICPKANVNGYCSQTACTEETNNYNYRQTETNTMTTKSRRAIMTDRYLFRGFHPCENGAESVWIEDKEIKGEWVYGDFYRNFIDGTPQIREYKEKTSNEVIPETVGQYTGLTDKNGKRIFENDVVRCWYEDYSKIGFDSEFYAVVQFGNPNEEYTWGYQLRKIKGDKANYDILLWVETEDAHAYCEVVGNIHDSK